jgi:capsular exopolysaccharide synthesis family protein
MNVMESHRRETAADNDAVGLRGGKALGFGAPVKPSLLNQYISIARRRKWIILGAVAAALLLGLVVTLLMTARYTAAVTLEIQRETRNFTNVEGAEQNTPAAVDLEFYQTQYGLLGARSLADRVATELRLFDDVHFFEMFDSPRAEEWFDNGRPQQGASTRDERIREAGDMLLKHFEILPVRLSRLVEIRFTSPDPAFSKRVIDAWGANFIQLTLERRFGATAYARNFLEGRLVQLRARIDESERALVDYAARNQIVNLPASTPQAGGTALVGERPLVAEDLAVLNNELARATAERIQAQSRSGASGGTVVEALANSAISGMRERRAELAASYAQLMTRFERDYPPAVAVQNQIDQLDRSLAREEARVRATLGETYRASRAREDALRRQVNILKGDLLDMRRRSIQYNIHQREVDTNRQLYDALLQRYKEIGVAGGVGVNNIVVIDQAELPKTPSSPVFILNMFAALILGLGVGIGTALALEQIDEGVADPADVEQDLNVPLLGTVPKATEDSPKEALKDRKSSLSEAYYSLQTNLGFSTDHGVPKTLAISSSRPGEGKTTTTYALAHSLARANRRTLLIDADLRSPSMHHIMDVENRRGLSNFLAGDDNISELIRPTAYNSLSLMTAGPQPPNAAELLSSDRFPKLLEKLLETYEHVVIDAPPVMGLADAPILASVVEGMIFVIESHSTKKSIARVAIRRLQAANAQILGAVLTKFDAKRAHYGYGYDYGYSYGYGNAEAEKSDS